MPGCESAHRIKLGSYCLTSGDSAEPYESVYAPIQIKASRLDIASGVALAGRFPEGLFLSEQEDASSPRTLIVSSSRSAAGNDPPSPPPPTFLRDSSLAAASELDVKIPTADGPFNTGSQGALIGRRPHLAASRLSCEILGTAAS